MTVETMRINMPADVSRDAVKLAVDLLEQIAEDPMLRGSQRAAARRGLARLAEALEG